MYKRDGKPDICLMTGFTDFRCGMNTLVARVSAAGKNPFSNAIYVFCNKRKDSLKIVYWGGSGFWLLQYRLEKGKFRWLKEKGLKDITYKQMEWLLDGFDVEQKHYNEDLEYDIYV